MALRSQQVFALGVLFVGLALIFVMVADAGVSTSVFLPESTATSIPTSTPSPTPTPNPAVDLWQEVQPGVLIYVDAEVSAQIVYQTMLVDDFTEQFGVETPPDDAGEPLSNVLDQVQDDLRQQLEDNGFAIEPDGYFGTQIDLVGGVVMQALHIQIAPQILLETQPYPGTDLELVLISGPDDQVTAVQYVFEGQPDPAIYANYRSWLVANAQNLVPEALAADETTDETETDEAEDSADEANDDAEADSDTETDSEETAE